jgi:hypothetical protein
MEHTETAADPRAKVSMKKIFGGPNTKKDGTQGKARCGPFSQMASCWSVKHSGACGLL